MQRQNLQVCLQQQIIDEYDKTLARSIFATTDVSTISKLLNHYSISDLIPTLKQSLLSDIPHSQLSQSNIKSESLFHRDFEHLDNSFELFLDYSQ